jgi:hypothetical protein
MMNINLHRRDFLACSSAAVLGCCASKLFAQEPAPSGDLAEFVQISKRAPRYFELTNGKPYIPIGLNVFRSLRDENDELTKFENLLKPLAENKGNFVRIFLQRGPYDIEPERSGHFDEKRTKTLARLFALARKYGIRLKLCLEWWRHLGEQGQGNAPRPMHLKENGGPAENTTDYFTGEAGRAHYKKKLDWYAEHFGSDPIVFGWELWNEMNNIPSVDLVWPWSIEMLAELHKRFPKNLAMQSLGSYDNEAYRDWYRKLCALPGNDVMQVHRYLDLSPGAWNIVREPVAVLTAQAIKELLVLSEKNPKPVILAETGAVGRSPTEPGHSGPFYLYSKDKAGIILHDVLFAPFFAGAAGPGHTWHEDAYVQANNLWFHFGRFAAVVEGLDPPAEDFQPFEMEHEHLYLYGLKGKTQTLIWCRDKQNTWKTELEEDKAPETLVGLAIDLDAKDKRIRFYDPWENRWTDGKADGGKIVLPTFRRSLVVAVKS